MDIEQEHLHLKRETGGLTVMLSTTSETIPHTLGTIQPATVKLINKKSEALQCNI